MAVAAFFSNKVRARNRRQGFDFNGKNFQIWEIPDIRTHLLTFAEEVQKMEATGKIFKEIQQKIDQLLADDLLISH